MRRIESTEWENKAIELLEQQYAKTNQFKHRQRIGEIRMAQLSRQERSLRGQVERSKDSPNRDELVQKFREFSVEKARTEFEEYKLILDHYPTDINAKFQVGSKMFYLKEYQEAIPILQQSKNDPKHRINASILLGQAFLQAGFVDEAVDTLKGVIDEYPGRGDERSIMMFYWYARALEEKKDRDLAIKAYSQVAQWNFNYSDVQARIKRLRQLKESSVAENA